MSEIKSTVSVSLAIPEALDEQIAQIAGILGVTKQAARLHALQAGIKALSESPEFQAAARRRLDEQRAVLHSLGITAFDLDGAPRATTAPGNGGGAAADAADVAGDDGDDDGDVDVGVYGDGD